jgi:hypothetical protein
MLATAGPLPQGDQWTYEVKWDGYRALVTLQPGGEVPVTVMTRAGNIVTGSYPELQSMADAIGIDASIACRDAAELADEMPSCAHNRIPLCSWCLMCFTSLA